MIAAGSSRDTLLIVMASAPRSGSLADSKRGTACLKGLGVALRFFGLEGALFGAVADQSDNGLSWTG